MPFTVGSFTIGSSTGANPAQIRPLYRPSGGADFGALFFLADSRRNALRLEVIDQTKQREHDGSTAYLVTVLNRNPKATSFLLQGGGLT